MSDLQSVQRALRLLGILQEEDDIGVTEASARLGISSSSAHRLLSTLEAEGYARHLEGRRRYELGGTLHSAGMRTDIDDAVRTAPSIMAALRDRSLETVHLAVLSGTMTRFLLAAESPQIMRVASRVGQRLPAHRTAGGKILLAQLSDDEVRIRYRSELLLPAAERPSDIDALLSELATTHGVGFGVNHGESENGVAALAVLVDLPGGGRSCCLTLSGPESRINPERSVGLQQRERELLAMLRESAGELAAGLAAARS